MKKIKKAIIFTATFLLTAAALTTTVYAEETTEEFDIFEQLFENAANAKVDKEDLEAANEELFGDKDYNPLEESKDSIKKFTSSLSEKEYDENDFEGNADKVYEGIEDGANKVVDSGILDSIYNFGVSLLNLFVNVISSIADAVK